MRRLRIRSPVNNNRHEMATSEPSSSLSSQPMLDATGFLKDAIGALDDSCPNWRISQSYILPAVFHQYAVFYRFPKDSDAVFVRRYEEAAAIVLDAIDRLLKCEGDYHPFVAFRDLDFHRLKVNVLSVPHIFNSPKARAPYERCLRKYDIVLIGPKIGMIFIEVSGAPFDSSKDFKPSSKLPERYKRRLNSLKECDMLFVLLRTLSNFTKETFESGTKLPIKRVFFTPNLERSKVDIWWSTLNDTALERNKCLFDGITTWFKEEVENQSPSGMADLPPFCTALHRLLSDSSVQLSQQIYEAYVPILVGLQSVVDRLDIEEPSTAEGVKARRPRISMPSPVCLDLKRIFGPEWKGPSGKSETASILSTEAGFGISSTSSIISLVKDAVPPKSSSDAITIAETPLRQPEMILIESDRIQSHDPCGRHDISLVGLAKQHLDKYCTGWNENGRMARSHIIPSVFVYKNPRLPDDKIQEWERKKATMKAEERRDLGFPLEDRDSIDRQSDHAEYIVFDAIQRLIREQGGYHPFLAFYRLDTHQLRSSFESIFPGLESETVKAIYEKHGLYGREFDFILIGPHIGIIVIEVKGSPFSVGDKKRLPERFRQGLDQLKSIEHLLDILKMVTNRLEWNYDATQIRKVLFTPNLPRQRYEGWLSALQNDELRKYQEDASDIELWFGDDTENELEPGASYHDPLPPLYNTMRHLLSDSTKNTTLPIDVYESFALVMTVMATFTSSSLSTARWRQFTLDESKFFRAGTNARGNNPVRMLELTDGWLERKKRSATSSSSIYSDILVKLEPDRHLFLTLEQQEALNGPDCQLIIGAAGTGKTVLLQVKAMEIMRKGEPVVIFTSNNMVDRYRRIFNVNGFKGGYKVLQLSSFHEYEISQVDHLLLDDISDVNIDELLRSTLTMSPNHAMVDRPIWISVDPFIWKWKMQNREKTRNNDGNTHPWTTLATEPADRCRLTSEDRLQPTASELIDDCADRQIDLLAKAFEWSNLECDGQFSAIYVRRVIRSPVHVFNEIYKSLDWAARPRLGHQIPGIRVQKFTVELAALMLPSVLNRHLVVDALIEKLKEPFDELITEFGLDQIALIYQTDSIWDYEFREILLDVVLRLDRHAPNEVSDSKDLVMASKRIFHYSEVSSMEFPGVFFLSVISKDSDEQLLEYASYCARTRCMQKLIEVRCHFF